MHLDGTLTEFGCRQCYGFPFRAAAFHVPAVVSELYAEENVSCPVEFVDLPAIIIDVDLFYPLGKDKCGDVCGAENLLPSRQAFDIVGSDPALKTCQTGKARSLKAPALYLGDDYRLVPRVQKVIETLEFGPPQRRPFLLIDGDILNTIIYQPVTERPLIVVEVEVLHLPSDFDILQKLAQIDQLLLAGRHILDGKLVVLDLFSDNNSFRRILR